MSRTPAQVSQDILSVLRVTDPAMSYEIGTPERKLVDAVAEAISESYIDQYIVTTNWDIDTLTGSELERFVGMFGFGRMMGRQATGLVTFTLADPATQDIWISSTTQVYVPNEDVNNLLVFVTTASGSIPFGSSTVTVPAECAVPSIRGNVPIDTITGLGSNLGVTMVTNPVAFQGGMDPETDDQLRERFKRTFLRNVAGTRAFYEALCLQHDYVSRVKVLGPIERYREQLQITGGVAVSEITNSKFTWPQGDFLSTGLSTSEEKYFTPGVHYTFQTVVPPRVTVVDAESLPNGSVVELEHEYTSKASRNVPEQQITNKIDIYTNGSWGIETVEEAILSTDTFSSTPSDVNYVQNFRRMSTGAFPQAGRRFQRLGSVPIVSFPDAFTIGNTTYVKGLDYEIVRGTTILRGSEREVAGIEWVTAAPPAAGTSVVFSYSYNRLPEVLNALIRNSKQITTDPLVHEAEYVYLQANLVIMFNPGVSSVMAMAQVEQALINWAHDQNFGAWIQVSDILAVAHGVAGVDNVRLAMPADDSSNYGIQVTTYEGVTLQTYTVDFQLEDDQLPVMGDVKYSVRSFNTFDSGGA